MEMGQEEHKAQVKIFPSEHSIKMHCSIPLQINSPLKGCLISWASFPICQCMKPNTSTTQLKILCSGQMKIYSPPSLLPSFWAAIYGGKKPPQLDTVPLLRTRQPYYLN